MTQNKDAQDERRQFVRALDHEVSRKLRDARRRCGVTQQAMAEKLGIAHQQIYKYETGANRISAGTMLVWLAALDLSADLLFAEQITVSGDVTGLIANRIVV